MPEQGLMPLWIFTSIPKSACMASRTAFAAIVTEFFSGSRVIPSEPGPSIPLMTRPEGIFLPSMMSAGS